MFDGFIEGFFGWFSFGDSVPVKSGVGRKKGSRNKSYKLDKHKREIEHYLKLGLTLTTISKLLQVHRLTVSAYINKHPELFEIRK